MRHIWLLLVLIGVLTGDSFGAAIPSLYWSERAFVYRSNLDGTEPSKLSSGAEIGGVAVDRTRDRLFFTSDNFRSNEEFDGLVVTGPLDGTHLAALVSELRSPAALTLDRNAAQVIWSDRELHSISIAGYDGADPHTILVPEPSIAQIEGLAFDPWERKLYFSFVNPLIDSLRPGGIARMSLDGGDQEFVVTGLVSPQGVAVDHVRKQVFWADPEFGVGIIGMANLDGSDKIDLVTKLDDPRGVAVDPFGHQLYWADAGTGKIQTHTFFLPVADVVTGLDQPNAVGLLLRSPLPGDTNDDGQVDLYDLNDVRNHFGAGAGPGDADLDGDVDLDDLDAVRNHFGTQFIPPPEELTSVPEPNSWALVLVAAGVGGMTRRARKSPTSVRR